MDRIICLNIYFRVWTDVLAAVLFPQKSIRSRVIVKFWTKYREDLMILYLGESRWWSREVIHVHGASLELGWQLISELEA